MALPLLAQAARDPLLVPGIYNTCDQWCMYCPATARCLAFRCSPEAEASDEDVCASLAEHLSDGLMLLKNLSNAEGIALPIDDALDAEEGAGVFDVHDPLERMGVRYLQLAHAYLCTRTDLPADLEKRAGGPLPLEVLAWYHTLVPAKIYRALVGTARAGHDDADGRHDSLVSAKVALIGLDRSLGALAALAAESSDPRVSTLRAHARRLRRELEARFPAARDIVRVGLDTSADLPQA